MDTQGYIDQLNDKTLDMMEFRQRYPFKPYQLALAYGDTVVEVISYPWQEDEGVRINVRTTLGDATTLNEMSCYELEPLAEANVASMYDALSRIVNLLKGSRGKAAAAYGIAYDTLLKMEGK